MVRRTARRGLLRVGDHELCDSAERRVGQARAFLHFAGVEGVVVVAPCALDGVVLRGVGLDQDASRGLGSPGSACDLGEELKGALGGAEIGVVQPDIREHDTHELHARKVVPLGHHLGSDQDIDLVVVEAPQSLLGMASALRGVAVEASGSRSRKSDADLLLEPLGPHSKERGVGSAARPAFVRRGLGMVAVVAPEVVLAGVKDQRNLAVRTVFGVAAVEAEDLRGEAPPIEEEDRLAAILESL